MMGHGTNGAARLIKASGRQFVRRRQSGEKDVPGPVKVLTRVLIETSSVRRFSTWKWTKAEEIAARAECRTSMRPVVLAIMTGPTCPCHADAP